MVSPEFKEVKIPASLSKVEDCAWEIKRTDLEQVPSQCFILQDLLSREECDFLVKGSESVGFDDLTNLFPSHYRSNDRILSKSEILAASLFQRISQKIVRDDCSVNPMGPHSQGIWIPYRLNECIKYCRYKKDCLFAPHRDGPWAPNPNECSIYTVIIYLNDDFEGGNTNFLKDQPENSATTTENSVICSVAPKAGSALIFKHELLHEAAKITTGTKYILRTEIMFRRINSAEIPESQEFQDAEVYEKIVQLYKDSDTYEKQGNSEKFLESYLAAIQLQTQAMPRKDPTYFLQKDVMLYLMEKFLGVAELCLLRRCSKSLNELARDPFLWKKKYLSMFSSDNVPENILQANPVTVDWFSLTQTAFVCKGIYTICFEVLEHELALSILYNGNFEKKYFPLYFVTQWSRVGKHSHQPSRVLGVNVAPKAQLYKPSRFSWNQPNQEYIAHILMLTDTRPNRQLAGNAVVVEPVYGLSSDNRAAVIHMFKRENFETRFVPEPQMVLRGYWWDTGIVIQVGCDTTWVAVILENESRILIKDKTHKTIQECKNYKPVKQKHTPLYYIELESTKPDADQFVVTPKEVHDFLKQHNKDGSLWDRVVLTGNFVMDENVKNRTIDERWVLALTGFSTKYKIHVPTKEEQKYDAVNGLRSLGNKIIKTLRK